MQLYTIAIMAAILKLGQSYDCVYSLWLYTIYVDIMSLSGIVLLAIWILVSAVGGRFCVLLVSSLCN